MIKWPNRASAAIRKLFEPLQDIDVYVEDENDEAFYRCLLKSAIKDEVNVARVFALGGRDNVIDAAKIHNHQQRRALFIIDGDLSWVKGEPTPKVIGLHCHDAYCVENLILCEEAISLILSQEAVVTEEDAMKLLAYDKWVQSIQIPLLELFSAFATAYELAVPKVKTVSQTVHPMCTQQTLGKELDFIKVVKAKNSAIEAAEDTVGSLVTSETYERIFTRLKNLPNPLDAVSGKDFLIPLIHFHLKSLGYQIRPKSIRIRLVSAGDMTRFEPLANALRQAAKGL